MKWLLSSFPVIFLSINYGQATPFCDALESDAQSISPSCLKQLHVVCNNSALSWLMFDASSKFLIPGMTYNNVIDFGNYPECLSIDYEDQDGRIMGKYCAMSVMITHILIMKPQTQAIFKSFGLDVNTKSVHTISLETFSKIIPQLRDGSSPVVSKYSTCVPDACTPQEVNSFYNYDRLEVANQSLIMYADMGCATAESNTDLEWGDIVFIVFLAVIVFLMTTSTAYDALCQNFRTKPRHPILISFSVLYNGKKLLYISTNTTEQIEIFNGMRFVSMMWVVALHAVGVYGMIPIENDPEFQDWKEQWTSRYLMSGVLAVDTFFFMSGFLLAFTYLKSSLEKKPMEQLRQVPKFYLHRYLRLTPSVAVMYFTTITILRLLGSGPLWAMLIKSTSDSCKKQWWKFFLYIQNYTNLQEMCVNPTWYLSADMQMFILAPIVLIPTATFINKRFKQVIWSLVALTALSVVIPMLLRYWVDESRGNEYNTQDRIDDFLIGFIFGAVMRMKKNKKYIFNPIVNALLWVTVVVVSLAFNIFWHDVEKNYSLLKYTLFMGFYRPVWCSCLIFMVYSCYYNQGGVVQWFLSRPSFQILGRLSYSMYVLHALVVTYSMASLKTSVYFSNYTMFYNCCGHIILTMILSVFWVLAFEFPMLTIDKYILGEGSKQMSKKQ